MPYKKGLKKRAHLDAAIWAWLNGDGEAERNPVIVLLRKEEKRQIWGTYRDEILSDWITEKPGTRPPLWWGFDAPRDSDLMKGTAWAGTFPVSRERRGGKGKTMTEKYPAIIPSFQMGIPASWYKTDDDDPPVYESQASYLERHGLLTESERKRLTPADFERTENIVTILGMESEE